MNHDKIVTNGGRVLAITSYGNSIQTATKNAQQQLNKISFKGAYFRKDIGEIKRYYWNFIWLMVNFNFHNAIIVHKKGRFKILKGPTIENLF